jgi:TatD DNase family protein
MERPLEFGDAHCHLDLLPESAFLELVQHSVAGSDAWGAHPRQHRVVCLLSAGVWPSGTRMALEGRFKERDHWPFRLAIASGLHPVEVTNRPDDVSDALGDLERLARHGLLDAVGESGFDLSSGVIAAGRSRGLDRDAVLSLQWRAALGCLDVAHRHHLPLILHSRHAWAQTCSLVDAALRFPSAPRVMIHCFPGSASEAARLSARGVYLSFGGVLTWTRSRRMKEAISACDPKFILLETDAPDLAPHLPDGSRPEVNSPLYLSHIAQVASELLGQSLNETAFQSVTHLQRFLGLTDRAYGFDSGIS